MQRGRGGEVMEGRGRGKQGETSDTQRMGTTEREATQRRRHAGRDQEENMTQKGERKCDTGAVPFAGSRTEAIISTERT